MVAIETGDSRLVFAPEVGGAVAAFTVYGSLVPFDLQSRPLPDEIVHFAVFQVFHILLKQVVADQ